MPSKIDPKWPRWPRSSLQSHNLWAIKSLCPNFYDACSRTRFEFDPDWIKIDPLQRQLVFGNFKVFSVVVKTDSKWVKLESCLCQFMCLGHVYVCTRTKAHSHPLFIRYQPTWLRLTDLKWHQTKPSLPNTKKVIILNKVSMMIQWRHRGPYGSKLLTMGKKVETWKLV